MKLCISKASSRNGPLMKSAIKLTLLLLILSCFQGVSAESLTSEQAEARLVTLCRGISNFDELSQMQELIDLVKSVSNQKNYAEYQKKNSWNFLSSDALRAGGCLHQADSIYALGPLLEERQNVCKPSHIDLIEDYKRRYIDSKLATLTKKFFKIYAYQVSEICKQNMASSLIEVEKQFISEESFEKVMPWLKIKPVCRDKYDVVPDLIQSEKDDPKEDLRCGALDALSSLKSINDLTVALNEDNKKVIDDVEPIDMGSTSEPASHEDKSQSDPTRAGNTRKSQFYPLMSTDVKMKLEDMVNVCTRFEQVYANVIIPIVRLASMGLDLVNRKFNQKCFEEKRIQRWFAVTLVCSSILNLHPIKPEQDHERIELNSEMKMPADHDVGVGVKSDVSSSSILPSLWLLNSIENKLDISQHVPGKLSNLKSKFVKNIVNLIESNETIRRVVHSAAWKKTVRILGLMGLVVLTLVVWPYALRLSP